MLKIISECRAQPFGKPWMQQLPSDDESDGIGMNFDGQDTGLDYYPCTYGKSRTMFRGPRVSLDGPYTVVIGSCDVYGRYVEDPFTDQLAERTGRRVVNLGVINGGIDTFVKDEAIMQIIGGAETVVIQAMGAQNLSNRYYTVHPRRNDRFLKHSTTMTNLYRDVDFSDFSFTRHMLSSLREVSQNRFRILQLELEIAWVARMTVLLSRIKGNRILLWIEDETDRGLGAEPLFVTVDMMQQLEASLDKIVHCNVTDAMTDAQTAQMVVPQADLARANQFLTPAAHERVAENLVRAVRRVDGMAA